MARDRSERRGGGSSRAGAIISKMNSDIRALNSSILIISQKMRYLVRNEKILGRNLLVLNKKLKEFEGANGKSGSVPSEELQEQLEKINETLAQTTDQLYELSSKVDQMSDSFASQEELKEMKYVVDAIDPLKFVTRKDVESIIENKTSRKKK